MRKFIRLAIVFLSLLTVAILLVTCTKNRNPIDYQTHPKGWNDPASANFHGRPYLADSLGGCTGCHGADLSGGKSGVACTQCHATYPHPTGWNDTTSTHFHGPVALPDSGRTCQSCHGANYQGGISGVACYRCHATYPHVSGWNDSTSAAFHALPSILDSTGACKLCHGANYRGIAPGTNCFDCHSYFHNFVTNSDINTHRQLVATYNWRLAKCTQCHGTDFAGGASHVSCLTCHRLEGGPANCETCHGLPPVDDSTIPFSMPSGAFGAHPRHAVEKNYACSECHPPANGLSHIHALPANMSFDSAHVANAHGFHPTVTHVGDLNSGNAACASVYCHSDGNGHPGVAMPQWVSSGLQCGACHRIPPSLESDPDHPQPPDGSRCSDCHSNVDPNSNFAYPDSIRFLVDSLHVNGHVDF
jgi:predicted CxxxxCH...CXXCH cytochrome family protein